MKICVFGTRGFPHIQGGVEKHCEELYPRMRDDIKITVFRRKPYVKSDKLYKNIQFVDLHSTTIKGFEALFHSFLSSIYICRLKPDLVHIHNIGSALFSGIIKQKNIPIVLTYHSPNYEHSKWGIVAKKLLRFSEKVALHNADSIIFVNKFQMEKYPEDIRVKSAFIPNGVNNPINTNRIDFLDKLGIVPNKYVLAVGRITPEKGFDKLIEAFTLSKHEGYKLVIAGGVESEVKYFDLLKKSAGPDVIFAGAVYDEDLAQLYHNAALFALSSKNEGFPLVLLEAMSYGLDVIASDIPGTHLVNLDKDDYFPQENTIFLSELISNRLINPKNRKYELDDFNWEKIALKTGNIFDMVLQKESGNLAIENPNGEQVPL